MQLQNLQAEFIEALEFNQPENILMPENMDIYRNNVYLNLSRHLEAVYRLVRKIVGDDYFAVLAAEYIENYPSQSGNLFEYGEYFSAFLALHPEAKALSYLNEVAIFEWTCHQLSLAEDSPAFDISKLQELKPEDYPHLMLELNKAAAIRRFNTPILKIIDLAESENEIVNLNDGGVNLLIIRRDDGIKLISLSHEDYAFLNRITYQDPLGSALTAALSINEEFPLQEKLWQWINDKVIVDLHLEIV